MFGRSLYYLLGSTFLLNVVVAEEMNRQALPEPLSLEAALKFIDYSHPDLGLVNSDKLLAEAELASVASSNDVNISLNATARWIEPPTVAPDQNNEDHRVSLYVNKNLYDFGRSSANLSSAENLLKNKSFLYLNAKQNKYIKVMQRYFDVLLADYDFYRYNEEMAVTYIRYDKLKDKRELGQVSDLEVAEKYAEYQKIFRLRTYSQNQQRIKRSLLAQELNRPDDLPSTLVKPQLEQLKRTLPEVETLQQQAKDNNLLLKSLKASVQAEEQKVTAARSSDNPVLSAQIETHAYEREVASSDAWRAGITLNVPLWTGGRTDAKVARQTAELNRAREKLHLNEMKILHRVLELRLKLERLKIQRDEMKGLVEYRELYLDRSRALYELEVQTDLGYSMVQFTAAEKLAIATDFEIALTWTELDALTGKLTDSL